jgi:hypothetical protein
MIIPNMMGKIKNVPNHQPAIVRNFYPSFQWWDFPVRKLLPSGNLTVRY